MVSAFYEIEHRGEDDKERKLQPHPDAMLAHEITVRAEFVCPSPKRPQIQSEEQELGGVQEFGQPCGWVAVRPEVDLASKRPEEFHAVKPQHKIQQAVEQDPQPETESQV